jgi:hypothetical protein
MARSRNRYSRAQMRAKYRKPRRKGSSRWFYGLLAAIVALGVAGVVFLRPNSSAANVAPAPADPTTGAAGNHWHTAFGVNICGQWLPNPPTFETASDNPNVRVGIHTHGDGYIHIHPYTRSEGGHHATLGRFFGYGGWSVSDTSVNAWTGPTADPAKKSWSNGDKCPPGTPDAGRTGVLRWTIDCQVKKGDPSNYQLKDQQVLAIAFIPEALPIPVTPNAAIAPAADSGTTGSPTATAACKPSSVNNPGVPDTALPPATATPPSTAASGTTTPSS